MTGPMMIETINLPSESESDKLALFLARVIEFPLRIYFSGPIGAGKSHLIRKLLQSLGVDTTIKSPTFTIVESYTVAERLFCHLDLYRLSDMEELECIGFREMFSDAQLLLIEWPEKVADLPNADISIELSIFDQGRVASLQSNTDRGKKILTSLKDFGAS